METYNQNQIIENLEKCPHFNGCSRNLCPLDPELHLRTGGEADKCRYMRNAKSSNVKGRGFISGGAIIPDALLNFTPSENIELLNKASQTRSREVNKINK